MNRSSEEHFITQGIGEGVNVLNQMRIDEYLKNLHIQDMNYEKAISELNKAREFLGSPEHILGSELTKHGEVAEVFEVRFGNADKMIVGEEPIYTFDGVGRTAPEDYLKNNLPVQSKFVQADKSISAIMGHLEDYPDFVQNGGTYCIPKDYYEQVKQWLKLSPEELAKLSKSEDGATARRIVKLIRELEEKTGKKFEELVEGSQLNYNQVQLKNASDTIDGKEQEITEMDSKERERYYEKSRASVEEGLKVAGIAAAVSGVLAFMTALISTMSSKKKRISELTQEDWLAIMKETGIGAAKGGVSGGAIYALTNLVGMSSPLAAGIVSATLGIASQTIKLYKKEISFDDYMYNSLDVATEAATSALGAVAGQALIPIPGVGAIIGSIVATTILGFVKKHLFGGGFYEIVKEAHYENEFSNAYRPLIEAFERANNEWMILSNEISEKLQPYIEQSERSFAKKAVDLHSYIEGS